MIDNNRIINSDDFSELYNLFANHYKVKQETSLFTYENGKTSASYFKQCPSKEININDLPNRKWAEDICRKAGVSSEPALTNCILDVALTNDSSFAKGASVANRAISKIQPDGSGNVNIEQGLLVYFPFSGSVKNLANPGMEIKNVGATFSEDRFGNLNSAAYFNGKEYVEIPLDIDNKNFKTLSISFWTKPLLEDINGRKEFVISNSQFEFWYGVTIGIDEIKDEVTQKWQHIWCVNNARSRPIRMDRIPITGEWTFVAATYNDVTQKITFYINDNKKEDDGVLDAYQPYFRIGRDAYEDPAKRNGAGYKGFVDDLRIYDRVLTDNEIDFLRNLK